MCAIPLTQKLVQSFLWYVYSAVFSFHLINPSFPMCCEMDETIGEWIAHSGTRCYWIPLPLVPVGWPAITEQCTITHDTSFPMIPKWHSFFGLPVYQLKTCGLWSGGYCLPQDLWGHRRSCPDRYRKPLTVNDATCDKTYCCPRSMGGHSIDFTHLQHTLAKITILPVYVSKSAQ